MTRHEFIGTIGPTAEAASWESRLQIAVVGNSTGIRDMGRETPCLPINPKHRVDGGWCQPATVTQNRGDCWPLKQRCKETSDALSRRQFLLALAAAAASIGTEAAGSAATNGAATADALPLARRRFLLGLGHQPAHKSGETPGDVQRALADAVALAARHSELFSVWTLKPWPEEWDGYYAKPSLASRKAYFDLLSKHHRLAPLFNVNFWTIVPERGKGLVLKLVVPPDLPASITLADAAFRSRWLEHVTRVAREFQPPYFSLGNEVDSFYHYGPSQQRDFDHYVSLVAESYDAVKAVSPRTQVMVVFRYEEMAAKKGYDLLRKFDANKLDLFGFTTYPDLQKFAGPSAIPPDYYRPILDRIGQKPAAFTEIGWATVPGDPKGETHQAEFLRWFLKETARLNLAMVMWPFLHDLASPEKKAKRSSYLGLRDYYGRPKPAWSLWQQLAALPRAKTSPSNQ
ncbi:MAG: arabinogalactan endo-1,4-beta-galactosidase [Verrucomicrobiae bacterium]|nr:arabinogalactan endo-1,4-beta-galactosidase [Verrucomicrobiae bacterium]